MAAPRDHGGGLAAARDTWGGDDWIDLSTGINPQPYDLPAIPAKAWTALPDHPEQRALTAAARSFWNVPVDTSIIAAPGTSALIARMPPLAPRGAVDIPGPTYNEHEAAFRAAGFDLSSENPSTRILVNPNNPTGRTWSAKDLDVPFAIIDESFCDVSPDASLVHLAARRNVIILKSFGKFWGLAGLRLGFAIGRPKVLGRLATSLGPWAISGPALAIGTAALRDTGWADVTRLRLARDAARLDALMAPHGAIMGGTPLFRLYEVPSAEEMQARLARAQIWSRIFPYSKSWIRLGLPPADAWPRLEAALA